MMMRLFTYNIAYGTGCPGNMGKNILTAHRYLRTPRRSIDRICRSIRSYSPDIVALVEVDTGSFRTGYLNQAELIAEKLGSFQSSGIKYAEDSIGRKIPILRRQANAILNRMTDAGATFHYFPAGFKRLVIELSLSTCSVFLVHLALETRTRHIQLRHLQKIVPKNRPVIVTGDFNTLLGARELLPLCRALSLKNANVSNLPTFPSWNPEKQLDFILYSPGIKPISLRVPKISFSDHLPLVFDFETEQRIQR